MNLYLRLLGMVLATRRRGRLHLWDTARISFRVLPTDLDVLGHMTNSRYLALMDIGRLDMMRRSGAWAEVKCRRWYAVVAGQTIAYRKSLNPWQRVDLYTRNIGSDHFPIQVVLQHTPRARQLHPEPSPGPGDEELAQKKIENVSADETALL